MLLFYLRQLFCAGHRELGQSHQTGKKGQDHTSEWQISEPEPPETSDLQTAAASPSSHPASLWRTPVSETMKRLDNCGQTQ